MKNFPGLSHEEKANVITHGMGLLLIILLSPLLIFKMLDGSQWNLIGAISFCLGALFVFFSSTYYHLAQQEKRKKVWRTIDHIAIFFLIGGTYTPFILKYHFTREGLIFLGIHWCIIAAGVIFKIFFTGRLEIISTILYLFLGWMVIFIIRPVTEGMSDTVLIWMIVGGISYTAGVIFYAWERLPFNHSIWHIFVLAGCMSHFMAIYYF